MKREELIESAARAMVRAEGRYASQEGHPWDVMLSDYEKLPYRNMATAALTAILEGLREPSEEMERAAIEAMCDDDKYNPWPKDESGHEVVSELVSARIAWQAMLSTLDDRSTHVGGEG